MICYYEPPKKVLEKCIKKIYINENKLQLLQEGAESKNMKLAKHYLYDNCGYNEEKAMQTIGAIKTDIPNVRLAKCKFILGVTRMFHKNELSDERAIMGINKALKYIASDAHINEYNNDLNGLSCDEIIQRFASVASADLENEKNELSQMEFNKSDYEIVKIPDFETAEQYGDYTDWCVTHYEDMYNNYTHSGLGLFYFCLKNGYKNVEEIEGENCPLDEYGLSMIAVSINEDGSCNTITCRWNHANGGNDNIMTPKELSQIIGYDFYQVFKPYSLEEINEKRLKLLSLFVELAVDDLETYSDDLEMLSDCCELCYDKDYDEDYEGEYYDINGELCNTEDDYGDSYQISHLKYIIVSSKINEELEEKLGEAYLIFNYSYGDFDLMFDEIFTYAEYLEKTNQFILQKSGKTTLYDCEANSFIISEEDNIEDIKIFYSCLDSLGLSVIKKNGYCYFYDFKNKALYDETPYKNIKNTLFCGKFFLVNNENNEENVYSTYIKNVVLEKWFQKVKNFGSVNGCLLTCSDDSSYTLYGIIGTDVKKITDNRVVSLNGYYRSYYMFDYMKMNNRYVYDFKTGKTYKFNPSSYSIGEEVNLNSDISESKTTNKKIYITENKLNALKESLNNNDSPLYHFTSFKKLIPIIKHGGKLVDKNDWGAISLTRNKSLKNGFQAFNLDPELVRFMFLPQDILRLRGAKIVPYSFFTSFVLGSGKQRGIDQAKSNIGLGLKKSWNRTEYDESEEKLVGVKELPLEIANKIDVLLPYRKDDINFNDKYNEFVEYMKAYANVFEGSTLLNKTTIYFDKKDFERERNGFKMAEIVAQSSISENKQQLKEYYQAPLYHFTDLYSAYLILNSGYVCKYGDPEGKYDNRMNVDDFASLSRTKNFYEGYQKQIKNAVRFEFDPISVMNNIRKSKILPFSAIESVGMSEFEERFYNENSNLMLDKNLKSISIKIGNISHLDYRTEWYRSDYDCEDLSDKDLNRMLIDDIVSMARKKYGIKVEFE